MRALKILAASALLLTGLASAALAQTSPGWGYGYVPTPAQWNAAFAGKQDYAGGPLLPLSGGTMTGKLTTSTPNTSGSGFNLPPGVAPSAPNDGDLWSTSSALFARINGVTYNITAGLVTPAALTKVDDTNVTLTLGGTPATSLLQAVSITAGWSGQLSLARGGTAANLTASNGGIFYSTASAGAILSGTATAGQMLRSGSSAAPTWSTTVWPNTVSTNLILYASSANTITGLATAANSILRTDGSSVPSFSTTLPALTLGGTISGGGNQINNVIIGSSTPLAGTFTTLTATTEVDAPHVYIGSGASPLPAVTGLLITKSITGTDIAGIQNSITITGTSADAAGMFIAPLLANGSAVNDFYGVRSETPVLNGTATLAIFKGFRQDDLTSLTVSGIKYAFYAEGAGAGGKARFGQTEIVSDTVTGSGPALNIGAGTASTGVNVNINGGASGSGAGAYFSLQEGGTNQSFFGTYSALFGGAYNSALAITSKASNAIYLNPGRTGNSFSATIATILNPSGGVGIGTATDPGVGGIIAQTHMQVVATTVGSLGTCNAAAKGQRKFVTDANSTTFHATAVGGGSNNMSVMCDGTNWYLD